MKEKKCGSCKENTKKVQIKIMAISLFILATSIYGFIEIVKKIINFF